MSGSRVQDHLAVSKVYAFGNTADPHFSLVWITSKEVVVSRQLAARLAVPSRTTGGRLAQRTVIGQILTRKCDKALKARNVRTECVSGLPKQ